MALKTLCNQHAKTALLHWPQLFDVALFHISHITGGPPTMRLFSFSSSHVEQLLFNSTVPFSIIATSSCHCLKSSVVRTMGYSYHQFSGFLSQLDGCPTQHTSCREHSCHSLAGSQRLIVSCLDASMLYDEKWEGGLG